MYASSFPPSPPYTHTHTQKNTNTYFPTPFPTPWVSLLYWGSIVSHDPLYKRLEKLNRRCMNYHFWITIVNWDEEPTVKYQAKFRQEEPMLPCYILGYSFET